MSCCDEDRVICEGYTTLETRIQILESQFDRVLKIIERIVDGRENQETENSNTTTDS